jgi:hypothetical protein
MEKCPVLRAPNAWLKSGPEMYHFLGKWALANYLKKHRKFCLTGIGELRIQKPRCHFDTLQPRAAYQNPLVSVHLNLLAFVTK